jgi:hypothetical protein
VSQHQLNTTSRTSKSQWPWTLTRVTRTKIRNFFIEKGIKVDIARRFVEDIGKWDENVKKAMPVHEIL